ncbi:MAG: hypothetical protein GY754_45280 [bacterium]|nr:hypothetical protein [bacterium]
MNKQNSTSKFITLIMLIMLLPGLLIAQEAEDDIEAEGDVEAELVEDTEDEEESEKKEEIKLTGVIRNDAYVLKTKKESNGGFEFTDMLENRLVVRKDTEDWKFYADGRVYLLYGKYANELGKNYQVKLMRSFIRYFTDYGDFTLGKTYINAGNMGIFNPFELDKSLNMNDLAYSKQGMLAFEYIFPLGKLSEGKVYIAYNETYTHYTGGFSLNMNALGFDFGIVGNRKGDVASVDGAATNMGGAYFKGDLGVGIQGAYAFHFDDNMKDRFSEANGGIDFSFFKGDLIMSAIFYYSQAGSVDTTNYSYSSDRYFYGRYYLYGTVTYIFDDFFRTNFGCFANLGDGSVILIPSAEWTITNGLSLTCQAGILTGKSTEEFSRDTVGEYSFLLRVEAKF